MKIGDDTRRDIAEAMAGMRGKAALSAARELATRFAVSVGYIYRISAETRRTGRARRRDVGRERLPISTDQLQQIYAFTSNYNMSAWQALRLAEQNDIIAPRSLSVQRYNRLLREQGIERKRLTRDVKPARRFEAPAPNMLHHFDTTKLEELHLSPDGTLTWDHRANRKNSRGEKPDPIWLYSMVDDFSRCKFAYLYRGLHQYNHLDFFFRAWSQKERSSEFPFYGIPRHLYMDCGGSNESRKVGVTLEKLGVHVVPTTPSTSEPFGARKHGKVERAFQDYAEWLKTFQVRPHTWEEAQESLYHFVLYLNHRRHTATGAVPFQRWLSIATAQQMPDESLYQLCYYEREQRVVTKFLTISIDRHVYRLPEKRPYVDWIERRIDLYRKPGDYSTVIAVHGTHEIALRELAQIVIPTFSYPREERERTVVERARTEAKQYDHSALRLWAQTEPEKKTAYLPKRGEEFDAANIAEKKVETEDGTRRWSFAPQRWLNKFEVHKELGGAICDRDARIAFVAGLMNGREKITDDELQGALRDYRTAATGTEDL